MLLKEKIETLSSMSKSFAALAIGSDVAAYEAER